MPIQLANNAKSFLSVAINTTDTTLSLNPGDGAKFPTLAAGDWFWGTLIDQTDPDNLEIIRVTDITGDTMVIERAQESTTAKSFVSNDLVEQRVTKQTLLDLNVGAEPTKSRVYLDEFYLTTFNSDPFNASDIVDKNLKYAPILIENWDSFWGSRVKVQVEDITNHVIYDDLTFLTINDMVTWTGVHGTIGGSSEALQTFVARPYETINEAIPVQTKLYGLNRFFSALKGRGNYTTSMKDCSSSADMENYLVQIFNSVFSFTGGTNPPALTTGTLELSTCWIPRSVKNMYASPMYMMTNQRNYKIDMTQSVGTRRVCRINGTGAQTFENSDAQLFSNDDKDRVKIVGLNENNSAIQIMGHSKSEVLQLIHDVHGAYYSFVMVTGVVDESDNDCVAISIKPIGIDQILLQMPDFSIYDFEMVFFNDVRQAHVAIKSFSSTSDFMTSGAGFDTIYSKMRIESKDWLLAEANNRSTMVYSSRAWNKLKWSTVRFRLRNKSTGEISNLSYAGIATDHTHQWPGVRMYVKSFDA